MTDLKPCPFCGSPENLNPLAEPDEHKPIPFVETNHYFGDTVVIVCQNCEARGQPATVPTSNISEPEESLKAATLDASNNWNLRPAKGPRPRTRELEIGEEVYVRTSQCSIGAAMRDFGLGDMEAVVRMTRRKP